MSKRMSLTQLQDHEAKARAALTKKRQAMQQAQAQLKAVETRALRRPCFVLGKLAVEAGLAPVPFDQLQQGFAVLARWAEDRLRFAAWLREHGTGPAPRFEPCLLPGMSSTYAANGPNGTGKCPYDEETPHAATGIA